MSYTTGTTHYNLPQTVGTDKRDWADTNQAFQDIDAALYGAVQDVAQAASDVDALESRMDTAEQNIATNTGDIAGLDTRLTTAEGAITSQGAQITDTRQDLEDMICAYNEASATSTHAYAIGDYFIYNDVLYRAIQAIAIGDTIVPDTNCTTTNVTTEITSRKRTLVATATTDGIRTWSSIIYDLLSLINHSQLEQVEYSLEYVNTTANQIEKYRLAQASTDPNNKNVAFISFNYHKIDNGEFYDGAYVIGINYNTSAQDYLGYFYREFVQYAAAGTGLTPSVTLEDRTSTIPSSGVSLKLYMTPTS